MPDVSVEDFRAWFPRNFEGADDPDIERAIKEALLLHDKSAEATLYLTAHLLSLNSEFQDTPDGGSGVILKETLGPKTVEYITNVDESKKNAFYSTTPFGRRFLALEARTPRSGIGLMIV